MIVGPALYLNRFLPFFLRSFSMSALKVRDTIAVVPKGDIVYRYAISDRCDLYTVVRSNRRIVAPGLHLQHFIISFAQG